MKGTVFVVRDIDKRRTSLRLESDGDLIGSLLAGHVLELRQERRSSPAVQTTAIHVSRAVSSRHPNQQLFGWVIAFVVLGHDLEINKPATQ